MIQDKTGRGGEAVESFRKAVALEPGSAEAHLDLGITLVDQYDRTGGFKEFQEAARLDPQSPAVHYNLGRFYFETANYETARTELEEAVRLDPDDASALYFLALEAKQNNDLARSTSLFEKVISLQPENADAQFLLGQNLEHEGKSSEAVAHWKLALQSDPNYSQALYNLARALKQANDPEAQKYQDRYDALQKDQQISDRVQQLGNFALAASNAQNWPQAFAQWKRPFNFAGRAQRPGIFTRISDGCTSAPENWQMLKRRCASRSVQIRVMATPSRLWPRSKSPLWGDRVIPLRSAPTEGDPETHFLEQHDSARRMELQRKRWWQ